MKQITKREFNKLRRDGKEHSIYTNDEWVMILTSSGRGLVIRVNKKLEMTKRDDDNDNYFYSTWCFVSNLKHFLLDTKEELKKVEKLKTKIMLKSLEGKMGLGETGEY